MTRRTVALWIACVMVLTMFLSLDLEAETPTSVDRACVRNTCSTGYVPGSIPGRRGPAGPPGPAGPAGACLASCEGDAKIAYLSVPGAAFAPRIPNSGRAGDYSPPPWSFDNLSTLRNRSEASFQDFIAPVYLPHGARILEVAADFGGSAGVDEAQWSANSFDFYRIVNDRDGDPGARQCIAILRGDLMGPDCSRNHRIVWTQGQTKRIASDPVEAVEMIDNENYAYLISVHLGAQQKLYLGRIKYEMP